MLLDNQQRKIDIKLVKDETQNFKHVAEFHNASFYYEGLVNKQPILRDFNLKINTKRIASDYWGLMVLENQLF